MGFQVFSAHLQAALSPNNPLTPISSVIRSGGNEANPKGEVG